MSNLYIIGTLSRENVIEEVALHYLRLGYSVSMVRKQPDKDKEYLIQQCFKNIENASRIVVIPHQDGTCGEGTQYEIAYAKLIEKRVSIWDENKQNERNNI